MEKEIPLIVCEISLDKIKKIVVALEGDWNPTMVTVWTREKGMLGFSNVTRTHSSHKPSLELYFEDTWLGIHCFNRIDDKNVFDEEFAIQIIEYVESKCKSSEKRRKK